MPAQQLRLHGGSPAPPRKRLHVRAIVRDGLRAFVGSQSLRKEELAARREVGLLINNPTVARRILPTFESDWAEWARKVDVAEPAALAAAAAP